MTAMEEIFLAHDPPLLQVPMASNVRGTVLHSSLNCLQRRGLDGEYFFALEPRHHAAMRSITPATWLPIELAVAHYTACDAMPLDRQTIESIGAESGQFLNKTVLTAVTRLTREMGATPWSALAHAGKLRSRTWVGSSIAIYKLGPKEARFEWVRLPVAHLPYYRVAFGAFMAGILGHFARVVFVKAREIGEDPAATITYRISWA